jgi:glutamate/aspartate transport system substrate-binding protein
MSLLPFRLLATAMLLLGLAGPTSAEDVGGADLTKPPETGDSAPAELTGVLAKIRLSGVVTLGFRDSAFPFSYARPPSEEPQGYSMDLCKAVVEEIVRELPGAPIRVAYEKVTAESRFDAVASGKIDLECGSTTDNLDRRKLVAFSPVIFIAGTKLMTLRSSNISTLRDLKDRKLVVTAGTTNENALHALNDKFKLGIDIVTAPDHSASFDMLVSGGADAFATDDVLLNGLIASHKAGGAVQVVGDFLTYEPYGLMYAKDDPAMAGVVDRAFSALAVDGQWSAIYRKWFLTTLPTGEAFDLPMSVQLSEAMRAMGDPGL